MGPEERRGAHARALPQGRHARHPLVDEHVPRHDRRRRRARRTTLPPPPSTPEPMPESATLPFEFWTRLTLTKLTGRQASDLAGLLEHLRAVPLSVVFHHTHHFLVQHQHLNPEPPNDFAYWVTNVLQESWLGERLAAIDTVQFTHLRDLRARLVEVIEDYLEQTHELRIAPAGEEFHFMDAVSFTFPTRHRASTLAEFADAAEGRRRRARSPSTSSRRACASRATTTTSRAGSRSSSASASWPRRSAGSIPTPSPPKGSGSACSGSSRSASRRRPARDARRFRSTPTPSSSARPPSTRSASWASGCAAGACRTSTPPRSAAAWPRS